MNIILTHHLSAIVDGIVAYGVAKKVFRIKSTMNMHTHTNIIMVSIQKDCQISQFHPNTPLWSCTNDLFFFPLVFTHKIQNTIVQSMSWTLCKSAGGQNKCMTCRFFPLVVHLNTPVDFDSFCRLRKRAQYISWINSTRVKWWKLFVEFKPSDQNDDSELFRIVFSFAAHFLWTFCAVCVCVCAIQWIIAVQMWMYLITLRFVQQ